MLRLAPAVYEAILAHAREAAPAEACGLLAGNRPGGTAPGPGTAATETYRATNVAPNPEITYEIDPEEQYRLMDDIESAGLELVGFYHSHPAGPHGPSSTDHARATWEGYHYLIASLGGDRPVLDAWVWTGDRFARDEVALADDNG